MSTSAPVSNATNFRSYLASGVDPRTGQFSVSVTLARLRPRNAPGLERAIRLAFSPLQAADLGYGRNWSLDTSRLEIGRSLHLSDGRSFHLDDRAGDTPVGGTCVFKDQKLQDVVLRRVGDDLYRVATKDGVIEELERAYGESVARLRRVIFPNGEIFTVEFGHSHLDTPQLTTIHDHHGVPVVDIRYASYPETLTTLRGGGRAAEWSFTYSNDELRTLALPHDPADPADAPKFGFDYDEVFGYSVLTGVTAPTGRRETVTYDQSSGHGYIVHGDRFDIPTVMRHEVDPGGGQPSIVKAYSYDASNRNFLGFPNENGWGDNQDNLYLAPNDYQYSSREDTLGADRQTPVVSTERTYNSYHLIVQEVTTRGAAQTTTTYEYNELADTDFYGQPANLQLPRVIATTFRDLRDGSERTETTVIATDAFGNTLSRTEPTGLTTTTDYYPPEGIAGQCPADPLGAFVRFPRRVVESAGDESRSVELTYHDLGVAHSEPDLPDRTVVLGSEIRNGVVEVVSSYIDAAGSEARGLLERVTTTVHDHATERHFSYSFPSPFTVAATCTVTGHDDARSSESRTLCRLTGQCLEQIDPLGVRSAYSYDLLGRLTRVVDAVGTSEERRREIVYEFPAPGASTSRVVEVAPDGIGQRASFDGNGRLLEVELQDGSGAHDPQLGYTGAFHVTERYQYDELGQLATEHAIDYIFDDDWTVRQTLRHVTTSVYDEWGGRSRCEQSSGRVEINERDPVRQTVVEGLEGLGARVSTINRFQMPTSSAMHDAGGAVYATTSYDYDDLGRMIASTGPTGATSAVTYDAFNRITSATQRGGRRLVPTYADFSSAPLVAALAAEAPDGGASHLLASREFDGLGRIVERSLGGRRITYSFDDGSTRPAAANLLGTGQTLRFAYDAAWGQRLAAVTAPDLDARFDYEPVTGRLAAAATASSRQSFEYSPTGLPVASTLDGPADGRTLRVDEQHSLRGRLVRRADSDGHELRIDYDEFGRPLRSVFNDVTATSRYDAQGRVDQVVTETADGRRQVVGFTYDAFNRETRREITIEAGGTTVRSERLELDYDVENRVTARRRMVDDTAALTESFDYDVQSRLVDYRAAGAAHLLPSLGDSLRVTGQTFSYSDLDAILETTTAFDDGSIDHAVYRYLNPEDPMQVSAVEHSHPALPSRIDLSYDAQGQRTMTGGPSGPWTYRYSSTGRLAEVIDPDQRLVRYAYDAIGRLGSAEASDGAPVSFTYLGERVIAQTGAAGNGRYFVEHQSLPVADGEADATPRLLVADPLRSVIGSHRPDAPDDATTYLPYGGGRGALSARQFTGALRDPASGLYLLGNGTRAYDPSIGAFLSADGWSPFDLGGVNPYLYCNGNPINLVDPSGHMSTGADLGLNIFCFILDAVVLGIAAAGAAVTGGASLGVGAAIVGASLGLVSDTLGIAADAMTIKDERDGVSDRADTIQNLGLASGAFGLAAMAVDVASMAGDTVGLARTRKGSRAPYRAQGQNDRVLMVSARPVGDDIGGLRWELFPQGCDGDIWRTDLMAAPDRPVPRTGASASAYDPATDVWREFKVRESMSWSGPALDFFGRSNFEELGRHAFDGRSKTVARGLGLFTGTAATAASVALLSNTTWEVANKDERQAQSMDVYAAMTQKLPIPPTS